MSIIRVEKDKSHPYVMINKSSLQDDRLTWEARGVLAYLLSKPDDWKVQVKGLINAPKNSGNKTQNIGVNKVRKILRELENEGYAKFQTIVKNGKIMGKEWVIFEQKRKRKTRSHENGEIEKKALDLTKNPISRKTRSHGFRDLTKTVTLLINDTIQNNDLLLINEGDTREKNQNPSFSTEKQKESPPPSCDQSPPNVVEIIVQKIMSANFQQKESWQLKYKIKREEIKNLAGEYAHFWLSKKDGLNDSEIITLVKQTGPISFRSGFERSWLSNNNKYKNEKRNKKKSTDEIIRERFEARARRFDKRAGSDL